MKMIKVTGLVSDSHSADSGDAIDISVNIDAISTIRKTTPYGHAVIDMLNGDSVVCVEFYEDVCEMVELESINAGDE